MQQDELINFTLPSPKTDSQCTSSQIILNGKIIPPKQHLLLMSAADWEDFIEEWGHFQKNKYHLVTGLGGAYDWGVDVACFYTNKGFLGEWDNFQCKYYKNDPLSPNTAIPEIGKILWHIFNQRITTPNKYYFFSPKDCGPSLKKLLLDSKKLRQKLFDEWVKWCSDSITSTQTIQLEGDFLDFVKKFDFNIFQYKPVLEVIEEHSKTPYHPARFGGGIKDNRPTSVEPPDNIDDIELRYTEQLKDAYADYKNFNRKHFSLKKYPDLEQHFVRQREAFYSAESLRTFARDSVPPGTFEELQNEMFDGVIDTAEEDYDNGLARLKAVAKESRSVPLGANGLFQVVKIKDRHGICHQLANEDKLIWVKKEND